MYLILKKRRTNFKCILSRDFERVFWAAVAIRIKILIYSRLYILGLLTMLSLSNLNFFSQSLEQFFLTVGQESFGNKIPFLKLWWIYKSKPNKCSLGCNNGLKLWRHKNAYMNIKVRPKTCSSVAADHRGTFETDSFQDFQIIYWIWTPLQMNIEWKEFWSKLPLQ